MIEVKNLVKRYGDHVAVNNLSFTVEEGQIYGFLGPNGAGKSTTMNIITGYLASTEGEVLINGHNILEEPEEAKKCIGYLPEMPPLYFDMTVLEYLKFVADLKKIPKDKKATMIEEIMDMVKITDMKNRLIKNLSKGYRQRVGIAQAVLGYPEVIILDEPTAGLDPKERARFRNLISSLSRDRIVILSTHIVSDIESIANQVIMIKDKKLYRKDTVANICSELDGEIFECAVPEKEFPLFEKQYLVLGARQEHGYLKVRYYDPDGSFARAGKLKEEWKPILCAANLEDVFLVSYGDEKTEVIL